MLIEDHHINSSSLQPRSAYVMVQHGNAGTLNQCPLGNVLGNWTLGLTYGKSLVHDPDVHTLVAGAEQVNQEIFRWV